MTHIEELYNILQMESDLTEELCSVLATKQRAIVRFQGAVLAEATASEENLLAPLEKLEAERLQCSAAICERLSSGAVKAGDAPKLGDVIALMGPDDATRIAPQAERLRKAVDVILRLNGQNKTLLEHSMQFVKETFRIITDDHTKQLIDQRI